MQEKLGIFYFSAYLLAKEPLSPRLVTVFLCCKSYLYADLEKWEMLGDIKNLKLLINFFPEITILNYFFCLFCTYLRYICLYICTWLYLILLVNMICVSNYINNLCKVSFSDCIVFLIAGIPAFSYGWTSTSLFLGYVCMFKVLFLESSIIVILLLFHRLTVLEPVTAFVFK